MQFDSGITGFMLLATSLVMLMTPGLAFFYGGLASKKNILGIMIQSFVSMGITTILWFFCGYSLCFSGGLTSPQRRDIEHSIKDLVFHVVLSTFISIYYLFYVYFLC